MENLILLHGTLGSEQQLIALKNELSKYTVYTLNFEGHGGRAINDSYSIDRFVQNVLDFMQDHELKSASFFGYSMGGYVALKLAANYPDKVNSIVTLGTKFNWTPESAEQETKMLNPEVIEMKIPKYAEHLISTHAPLNWKEVLKGTAEMMVNLGNGAGLNDDEIRSIHSPVQIGIGDLDQMVSLEESHRIAELLPNASFKIYKGFPHPIDRVDIHVLTESITTFIK